MWAADMVSFFNIWPKEAGGPRASKFLNLAEIIAASIILA